MAKSLLFLLTLALALVAVAGNGYAADDGDMTQKHESMAEVIRMSSDPASQDAETMHRATMFMRRELGPFGVVFSAIDRSAADARTKKEAREAAEELLVRHQLRLVLGSDKTRDACRQSGRCPSP